MIVKSRIKKVGGAALDGLMFVLGSALFAVSVNVFSAPNNIAPGGLTGIATLVHYLTQAPIGTTILLLNIPIFIWGFIEKGRHFIIKTAVATVISSLAIDLSAPYLPAYRNDLMLASVFGGVLAGIGLGLIFMRGGTTGGTDMIANILSLHIRHLSMGKLVLLADMVVVLASIFVFRTYESPMYALITIFITSKLIDSVLYGVDSGTGKMMFIVSRQSKEIADVIMDEISRGVTLLKSRGGYSGIEGEVLLCAVRRQEVYRVHDIAYSIDPDAFIMVGDAGEISGEGFREIKKEPSRKKQKRIGRQKKQK